MKVLSLSTSPREGSNTLKVSKAIQKMAAAAGHSSDLGDFLNYDIPMVGQGSLDKNNLSTFQSNLVSKLEEAQVIILAAPEYNWMTSGQLINAIHQLGGKDFAHLFNDKVFALVGVSAGRGGRLPAVEMMILINKMINFLDQYSIVSPRIFEAHETGNNVDADGNLGENKFFNQGLESFFQYTMKIAERWF